MSTLTNIFEAPRPIPGPQKTVQPVRPKQKPNLRLVYSAKPLHPVLEKRDPKMIRKSFRAMATIVDRYFRAEVEGMEHFMDNASMIVSTHNGSFFTPDLFCLMVSFWRRFGLETPGYGLMHGAAFRIPFLGPFLTSMGAIPANKKNAKIVLDSDYPLLVCPGGDVDSLKPFSKRHQICFGNRRGFIRTAIEHQVPIIPVVSVGAHETMFVLNDGRWLAQVSGFAKYFRIKSIPLVLSFPFGLTPAGLPSIPLPSKIRIRMLPKIELDESPSAAKDPVTVERCFEHVRWKMQSALDDLAFKRKWPILG